MVSETPYGAWNRLRRRETPLRLGLAVAAAGLGFVLIRSPEVWAWLALVFLTQAVDAALLERAARVSSGRIPRTLLVACAASAFVTAFVFSGLSAVVLRRGDPHALGFAILLVAGALLNVAMTSHKAPRIVAAAWAGHLSIFLVLPWLVVEPVFDVVGVVCATSGAIVFVAHLVLATSRSVAAERETRAAWRAEREASARLQAALRTVQAALDRSAAAERRLSLAAEIADLHIYDMDLVGRTFTSDGAPAAFLEAPMNYEAMRADGFYLVDPRDRPQVERAWSDYISGRAPYRTEYRLCREDQEEVWVFSGAELLRDERGRATRLVGVMRDLTQRKRAEAELIEARNRAEAGSQAKSDFLAVMSHEIRTPLNGVLGMVQVMQREPLPELQLERLEVIRRSGELLLELLNNALDLSRIEAGRLDLEAAPVDVAALARSVADAFRAQVCNRDVIVALEVDAEARGCFETDATRLRQILNNLVSNAVKFTEAGHVRVSLQRTASGLRFRVADSGIGMSPEQQTRLFEKFVQADPSTTRRFGGSGLGLAITHQLVALMGGTLSVESRLGEGSAFTVDLPVASLPSSGAELPSPAADAALPTSLPPMQVLVAEDNPVNQIVLRTLLHQVGVDPHVVEDGRSALEAWAERPWDVILMDVQMPVMDGLAATAEIRRREREERRARTPIVALTANVMAHQVAAYLAAGMDATVAKPIDVAELFRAMEQAVGAAADAVAETSAA